MNNNPGMIHDHSCKCFSWKPIFAGALIIIGFTFLLNIFSVAIGLTVFSTSSEGVEVLVLSGLVAAGLGIVVSMFGAGWLTGYLSQRHCDKRHLGALYGFLAWCLALIIGAVIATHMQQYVSFYGHFLSGTADVIQINNTSTNTATVAITATQPKSLIISTYIIFALFFLSAFSCSFGGHCGMRYICKD